MAKPQIITVPFVLLLWDYWPFQRMFADRTEASSRNLPMIPAKSFSWLILEKLPLFAICVASAVGYGASSAYGWHSQWNLLSPIFHAVAPAGCGSTGWHSRE